MYYPGYNAYKTYVALKNHFTSDSYDYFKYKGKARVKEETFLKRKDKFFFEKIEKKYQEDLVGLELWLVIKQNEYSVNGKRKNNH